MTDLDDRLRSLAVAPVPDPLPTTEVRRRAGRRARRRRGLTVALPVLAVLAVGAAVLATRPEPDRTVRTSPTPTEATDSTEATTPTEPEPGPTTSAPPSTTGPRLIGVTGASATVEPGTDDLHDGDLLTVQVSGMEQLPDAAAFFCAGDVTADDALSACDLAPGPKVTTDADPSRGRVTLAATRILTISARGVEDGPIGGGYDCATEPAGCVLVVAPIALPVRAVLVPVTFVDEPLPTAAISLDRSDDLHDGDVVTAAITGLRPNSHHVVRTCLLGDPGSATNCDEVTFVVADGESDAQGRLTVDLPVQAGFYGYRGRTDCTVDPCAVVVQDPDLGAALAARPITFAADATFPTATLVLDPPGRYVDGQVVTVRGTGFPPGLAIGNSLGTCPADKDPAVEERCGYQLGLEGAVVRDDGTFAAPYRIDATSGWGHSCRAAPGCLISWVIPKGPAGASVAFEVAG